MKTHEHRPEAEIIADLETLCSRPGYAHALAFLCWRNNFKFYGEKQAPDDLDETMSSERLLRSELSFLTGLMVKNQLDIDWPSAKVIQEYIDRTTLLMQELHKSMAIPFLVTAETMQFNLQEGNETFAGKAMREPFFYSSESAFSFQYRDFSPDRYNSDKNWLLEKKGFSPEAIKKLINAISKMQIENYRSLMSHFAPEKIDNLTLLPIFLFTAEELSKESQVSIDIVKHVIEAFSLRPLPCNQHFSQIGAYNETCSYPIIPIDSGKYILFQSYNLAESSYETPFFWMSQDQDYAEKAKENRGAFTEGFSAKRLGAVLGTERVYSNVKIKKGKEIVGEIDVFAIYADRAIILEAKSKKLTVASKTGSDEHIKKDFNLAVQTAYDQAFRNAEFLINDEYKLTDEHGYDLSIRNNFSEIFIFCVISDHYPALSFQVANFLEIKKHPIISVPYVMDVFFLDVMCEILDCPLHLFNYLNRRLRYFGRVNSEIELAVLGHHLNCNLWFDDEPNMIHLDAGISLNINVAMMSRRDGFPGATIPEGILTKLKGTFFDLIIQKISNLEKDNILDLGYFLLEFNEETLRDFSDGGSLILERLRKDGKPHNLSILSGSTGITIHVGLQEDEEAFHKLYTHCAL